MKVNDYVTEFETRINEAVTPEDILNASFEIQNKFAEDETLSIAEKNELVSKTYTMYMTAMYWKPTDMVKKYPEEFDYDAFIEGIN